MGNLLLSKSYSGQSLNINIKQTTLKAPTNTLTGIGLQTGMEECSVTMFPAPPDSGYLFQRVDLASEPIIQANLDNVLSTSRCTKLGYDNISVTLVEHVLAALRGMEVDNCLIQVYGPEVPILDGSALPFCKAIQSSGGIVESDSAQSHIVLGKTNSLEISVDVDFTSWSPQIGVQWAHVLLQEDNFINEVAPARTFALADEIEELQRIGILKGVRADNTILIPTAPLDEGMRFINEIARHKLLDVIGDIALLGKPVIGTHLHFSKPGHTKNIAWCKKVASGLMG